MSWVTQNVDIVKQFQDKARAAGKAGELEAVRNEALREAANACCHPTNVKDGGASALCRGRVLALIKEAKP
jgi:hypothetical protein